MMSTNTRTRLKGTSVRPFKFTPLHQPTDENGEKISTWTDYQDAFDEGYEKGIQNGHQEGLMSGHQEGLTSGHTEGLALGRREGRQQGLGSIEGQLNELITPLSALKELLEDGHNKQVSQQQELIIDLVRRVALQVIRCELSLQPQQILKLVEETISALPDNSQNIKIHLEPTAVMKLQELAADKIKDWQLVADASITAGGCRIISDKSDADASMETRLNTCMDNVKAHLNSQNTEVVKEEKTENA